jgi:glycosyltransferase involved in cell wall biosynthesis
MTIKQTKVNLNHVTVIGTVGVPSRYGGFESLVENLLDSPVQKYVVYCSSLAYENKISEYKGSVLRYIHLQANGPSSMLYDAISVLDAAWRGDRQLLILGVSGSFIFPLIRFLKPSMNLVINIDGIEWKRQKWGRAARWLLRRLEYWAVRHAHVVIADNQAIAHYVQMIYGRDCEVIAYGGDHAVMGRNINYKISEDYAFSVCRIEPENNIHVILQAFHEAGHRLRIVGNWQSSDYGRDLKRRYGTSSNIELLDPIYEIERLYELRARMKFYVHGHSAGGTNPSLVEAMHFGRPILAFDCVYNRATLEGEGEYFYDVESLKNLIGFVDRPSRDAAIIELARRRYTWDEIRKRYEALFDS